MEQLSGFVARGEFGLVCKLRHSLYELKHYPQAWLAGLALWFKSLT